VNRTPRKQSKHSWEVRLGLAALVILFVGSIAAILLNYYRSASAPTAPQPKALPHITNKEITHGDRSKRQVIFTFDAGDASTSAETILSVLAKHHVIGTFFMTGKFIQANPSFVREAAAAGAEIFSHTYDHPHLPTLSDADIALEFTKTESLLQSVADISPKPFFRAPYGDRDSRVLADAYAAGYESIYWTVDALDWEERQGETDAGVTSRIMDSLAPGNIYLMHVGDGITGRILDGVFTAVEAKGYRIVSLTQGI